MPSMLPVLSKCMEIFPIIFTKKWWPGIKRKELSWPLENAFKFRKIAKTEMKGSKRGGEIEMKLLSSHHLRRRRTTQPSDHLSMQKKGLYNYELRDGSLVGVKKSSEIDWSEGNGPAPYVIFRSSKRYICQCVCTNALNAWCFYSSILCTPTRIYTWVYACVGSLKRIMFNPFLLLGLSISLYISFSRWKKGGKGRASEAANEETFHIF